MTDLEVAALSRRWYNLDTFKAWRIVRRTYRSTEDGKYTAYFIVNEDDSRCCIVHNDIPLASFSICSLPPSDEGHYDHEEEAEEFAQDTIMDQGEEDAPFDGIDLEFVSLYLSEDGEYVGFSGYDNGKKFVWINSFIMPVQYELVDLIFGPKGRACRVFYDAASKKSEYHLDGMIFRGAVSSFEFTPDGKHFVALVRESEEDCASCSVQRLDIDGKTVLSDFVPQRWGDGDGEEEVSHDGYRIVVDPNSRSILFGALHPPEDEESEDMISAVYTYYFESEELERHDGLSILLADNSSVEDCFEVIGTTAEDNHVRPRKFNLPRVFRK